MTGLMQLTRADDCPSCGQIHGQPTSWPQCPKHGHWMYELGVTGDGWAYACHAPACAYTHTQPERATMTTATEAATAALAIRPDQREWTGEQLAVLTQLGVDGAPDGDLKVFFHYCQATGLDPFAKQIRLRKDRSRVKDADGHEHWVDRWSIETEIDGYRVIAHRAAKRDGVVLSYGPPKWYDRAGGVHEIWLSDEPPAGAARTVYKDSAPFPAVVRLRSFAKYTSGGQLQAMWAVMPDHLLGKCAEAQALRMAFPHDLEGIGLSDEPVQASAPQAVAREAPLAVPVRRQKPAQARKPANGGKVADALKEALGKHFDRIGITDADERDAYIAKLAGNDYGTDHGLRFALQSLAECADLAELLELCPADAAS